MKLPTPFTIYDLRFTICKKSSVRGVAVNHQSSIVNHKSTSGIALVITLILLSVTLIMAVAFLAVARRERNAVTTTTDTAAARLAADTALAAAQAQIAATILATNTGSYNYSLLVSTNYINGAGYFIGVNSPTNVNYDYRSDPLHTPLNAADLINNVANLYLLPRAPVFVYNRNTGSNDFRFYLDLNRNGIFETNNPAYTTAGDPEWVGVLEHPGQPHSANNKFVARYAFLAQPIGNSLDLNSIHNESFLEEVNPAAGGNDSFFRNQSVGSWELNLGAFLADLNTNQWNNSLTQPYQYYEPASANRGYAFEDALSLVSYRYANNYNNLAKLGAMSVNAGALQNQQIDVFPLGPLMTNTGSIFYFNNTNNYWAGSDNTNRFFSLPSDVFDTTKNLGNFPGHLQNIGQAFDLTTTDPTNNYNRYTFYRLLDQLGTDSTADDARMNLNYRNVTNGVVVPGMETNCYVWTPLEFFTNAANRLLTSYTAKWLASNTNYYTNTFGASTRTAFGAGNIPVYVDGQFVYTPAVNRLLQLAANMYDATVNNQINGSGAPDYPDVFRPLFSRSGTNLFITGFTNITTVTGVNDPVFSTPFDAAYIATILSASNVADNIYGVPWIIGAKKGLPNFNEFSMENVLSVTRRLQLTRTTNASAFVAPTITSTNQMYTMALNSSLGIELWNSYASNYPGAIIIQLNETNSLTITNDDPGFQAHPGISQPLVFGTNITFPVNTWQGTSPWYAGNPNPYSFQSFLFTGPTLTNSVYRSPYSTAGTVPLGLTPPCLIPTNYFGLLGVPLLFESNSLNGFHFPQFGVVITNRLQVYMLDVTNGIYHIIDYVHFAGPDSRFNVNSNLADPDINNNTGTYGVWNTNYPLNSAAPNGPTLGILSQLTISQSGTPPAEDGSWHADPQAIPLGGKTEQQQAFFQAFFKPGNKTKTPVAATNSLLSMQAPYAPTRYVVQYLTWQVNDPLVHYLGSDIDYAISPNTSTTPAPGVNHYDAGQNFSGLTSLNLGRLNDRFTPWGGNTLLAFQGRVFSFDTNAYNLAERDPLVTLSDKWDFPTNRFPNVGWLGRVHRGTPWQTVYLKASDILAGNNTAVWQNWTGDGVVFDATNSAPVQDRDLFDLFTSTFSPNASRGTLSVNQTHLAAWSAVFSGLVALTNVTGVPSSSTAPSNSYVIIPPAGAMDATLPDTNQPAVWQLVNGFEGINATRANTNLFPIRAFTRVGDILSVPAFTEKSPFINRADASNPNDRLDYDISDEVYEWLPQETLGLLRVDGTPRYVVYCYGQTLRPAPNGLVLASGNYFGLCTNYQVTAESAARAVMRIEKHITANGGTNYSAVIESFNPLPPN